MMTISQITLILFVAVTFGAAQRIPSETEKAINKCYYTNFFAVGSFCLDYDAVEKCVNQITPHNDEDREMVKATFEYVKEQKTACPAFPDNSKCIETELNDCMQNFRDLKHKKEKRVCKEISEASACLIKFNDTCTSNVIEYTYAELEEVEAQCSSGHWDDGECSPKHVFNCTASLFNDFTNGSKKFSCELADVVKAKKCLSAYKAKCTTKDQQREVELNYLTRICPPA